MSLSGDLETSITLANSNKKKQKKSSRARVVVDEEPEDTDMRVEEPERI